MKTEGNKTDTKCSLWQWNCKLLLLYFMHIGVQAAHMTVCQISWKWNHRQL